jgi:hypothetical protein
MILPLVPTTFFSETFYSLRVITRQEARPHCLIGGNAYVSLRAYLRKRRTAPPGSRISSLAGLDSRRIRALEKGGSQPGRSMA